MSKSERTESQNFKLTKEDMKFVKAFLKDRDKEEHPYVGDYLVYILKKYIEYETGLSVDKIDLIEEMKVICPREELMKTEEYFICARGGVFTGEWDKRKKPSAFKIGKVAMTLDIVRRNCAMCYNNRIKKRY